MTVNTTSVNTGPYTGDGNTSVYPYDFRILSSDQLTVIETDSADVDTTLTEGNDYTVSGVGDANGGNVTLTTALTSGYTLLIKRVTDIDQQTDFDAQGTFDPTIHEDAFDKLTMIQQEHQEFTPTVGTATERAGYILSFDSSGNTETNISADDVRAVVASGLAAGSATTVDAFTGDGSTTDFVTSSSPPSVNSILATIDGVVQRPTTDYTLSNKTVTFTTAPPDSASIVIRNLGADTPNRSGQETLVAGTATVTFATAEPNASYIVVLSGNAAETFYWASKTTAGFTINSSNGSSTATVDWVLVR